MIKYFIFFLLIIAVIYAHWIEPVWIEVTRHTIVSNKIKTPIKVAHLTDLHITNPGKREDYLINLLNQEKPDLILISGDSIAADGNYDGVISFYKKLRAPSGVWLVRGNWEHWRPINNESTMYANAGIKFLNNNAQKIRDDLWVIGLDDNYAGNPDEKIAMSSVPKSAFKIGIFHSPDYFDKSQGVFDLVFSGHTHGGQVRIPFLQPLWLPEGSGRFISGWYDLVNTTSRMYVSRGIGNSILEVRFLCRPELPIINITPK